MSRRADKQLQSPLAAGSAGTGGFSFVKEGVRYTRMPWNTRLERKTLRLLSFNIQAGIGSGSFRDYLLGSWKHLIGHGKSINNIEEIASLFHHYDVVGLQEVDGGSYRSRNLNQLAHLATLGEFTFWHQQLNRNLGRLGQFSNGLLSRVVPYHLEDHRLPGLPGRGAILAYYGHPDHPLVLAVVHLALGERYRNLQLSYLTEQLKGYRHIVMMGDFNCHHEQLMNSPLAELELKLMDDVLHTYPSWSPNRHLDHILASPSLDVHQTEVINCALSDHLPIAMEISLPDELIEHSHKRAKIPNPPR